MNRDRTISSACQTMGRLFLIVLMLCNSTAWSYTVSGPGRRLEIKASRFNRSPKRFVTYSVNWKTAPSFDADTSDAIIEARVANRNKETIPSARPPRTRRTNGIACNHQNGSGAVLLDRDYLGGDPVRR